MQLTSPSRRVLGILAAGTIGLSTALLGVTGVAQATVGPNAPTDIDVYGADGSLDVWLNANNPADDDLVTPWSDTWEYSLASTGGAGNTVGFEPADFEYASGLVHITIEGLTNGTEYTLTLHGVSEDAEVGADATATGTPFKTVGAPGTPTVVAGPSSLQVSWTASTEPGTYPLAGYAVSIPVSHGESGGLEHFCETNAATTSCSFGIAAGVAYDVFVTAIDSLGNESAESGPVSSGVVPAPAVPASVPTKNGDLVLAAGSSSSIAPGKKVTVTGTGYAPGSSVSVVIYSTPQVLTTIVADASGNFTVEVTVPAGLAAGSHTLVASGVDANGVLRYVTLPVTVTSAGTASLAYTGADVLVPAIGGLAAVVVGAGLIVVRRRSAASAA